MKRPHWLILSAVAVPLCLYAPTQPSSSDAQTDTRPQRDSQREREMPPLIRAEPAPSPTAEALLADLKAVDRNTRHAAVRYLAENPKAATAPLVAGLSHLLWHVDVDSQVAAVHALAVIGDVDAAATPRLADMLGNRAMVQAHESVLVLLTKVGDKAAPAAPALAALVEDRRKVVSVRIRAAEALARIGEAAAAHAKPALRTAIADPRPTLRVAALEAISHVGVDPADRPLLAGALSDAEPTVALAAVRAMQRVGFEPVHDLIKLTRSPDRDTQHLALRSLAELGPAAGPALDAVLRFVPLDDDQLRSAAAAALAAMGDASLPAEPALARIVAGSDRIAMLNAMRVLQHVSPRTVHTRTAAIDRLADSDSNIRLLACLILTQAGSAAGDAVPALIRCLSDDVSAVRITAVETLAAVGPAAREAIPHLRRLQEDENMGVRLKVFDAIEAISRPEATAGVAVD